MKIKLLLLALSLCFVACGTKTISDAYQGTYVDASLSLSLQLGKESIAINWNNNSYSFSDYSFSFDQNFSKAWNGAAGVYLVNTSMQNISYHRFETPFLLGQCANMFNCVEETGSTLNIAVVLPNAKQTVNISPNQRVFSVLTVMFAINPAVNPTGELTVNFGQSLLTASDYTYRNGGKTWLLDTKTPNVVLLKRQSAF